MSHSQKTQLNLQGLDPLENRTFKIRKRDGRFVSFEQNRIYYAIENAFKADLNLDHDTLLPDQITHRIQSITEEVARKIIANALQGELLDVERIQDVVEKELMVTKYYSVARVYILYREERRKVRALDFDDTHIGSAINVRNTEGQEEPLDFERIQKQILLSCKGLEATCTPEDLTDRVINMLYKGVKTSEISKAMILAARERIEQEPAYTYVAARLLLQKIYQESSGATYQEILCPSFAEFHSRHFKRYLEMGVEAQLLNPQLLAYNIETLSNSLQLKRDSLFTYIGLQTLYDRYLIKVNYRHIEPPQYFWMRVAMGLAIKEENPDNRAIEFYNILSTFRFISSTPTLFNSGTQYPQLSSCYLSTIEDDLGHIFKCIADNAKLSKWAGGLGNDWTNIRASGAKIQGTNGQSQGVIPFLKVANDTAVAVNQGGKRKGAMCAYLETWHLDIESFLELRKNTGDERRRTHDMNTANWIPDLFMKRVIANESWTLFSPDEVRDLHSLYGKDFEDRYVTYEGMAEQGQIKLYKRVNAVQLWRKMLSMLFETGHPWITFKDPSNIRSTQDHTGVVHSSNLCTEILLNTSQNETAVCNLGSINLIAHIAENDLNEEALARTIQTAIRMLDNVIDINYYPTPEARQSNLKHRPIGLGIMGFQDVLYKLNISYASEEAVQFSDRSMEIISYYAILASSKLAKERGTYTAYEGSKWERGLLPINTLSLLEKERGNGIILDKTCSKDWIPIYDSVKAHGMRNSNVLAIAPTATIANIVGITQSIEPTYKHLYVKSNLSGEFTIVNEHLVSDLKALDIWDKAMLEDLKYYDGSIQEINRIPSAIRQKYLTAFEIDPKWLIECASRRQKWIDMGQSLNLYIAHPSGSKLHTMYIDSWQKGLKTTYYLRSVAATQIEKSTVDINRRSIQPRWMKNRSASSNIQRNSRKETLTSCSILDSECEGCQ